MRCPLCRADNTEGPVCRRCRADLSLLFDLDRQRAGRLQAAREHAQDGDWHAALSAAVEAQTLRRDTDAQQLICLCRLMLGDFAGAWRRYQRLSAAFGAK